MKLKHLEFIQNVIIRFSNNSFLLKGWSVSLVTALFALSVSSSNKTFLLLAYIPAVIFWGLDGYFLSTERQYRKLYDIVRQKANDEIDFSMNIKNLDYATNQWALATLSKTLFPFHCAIIGAIIIIMFIQ